MEWLNTWYIIRSAGITSYLLLTVSILSGLYMQIRKQHRASPGIIAYFHQPVGNWALYLGLFHGMLLLYDRYVTFHWYELLLPFKSQYRPIPVGLGILALYGLLFTLLTTKLRGKIGVRIWKKFHVLNPIAYVLATFHGIFSGTDSGDSRIMLGMYMGSALLVAIFLMIRISEPQHETSLKRGDQDAPVGGRR